MPLDATRHALARVPNDKVRPRVYLKFMRLYDRLQADNARNVERRIDFATRDDVVLDLCLLTPNNSHRKCHLYIYTLFRLIDFYSNGMKTK